MEAKGLSHEPKATQGPQSQNPGGGESSWMLGVGREGGEAKLLHFKDGDTGMTAVGFMDVGNTRRNKLEESHFGRIPP